MSSDTTTDSLDLDASTQQLTDLVVANPVPSVLAAAATGAALMALAALIAKPKASFSVPDLPSSIPTSLPSSVKLPDIDVGSLKDQLTDLAQRVAAAFPSKGEARQQLQDAQGSVQDAVQSTWATVRDQASGVIDQVQPQIAAATKVARENPLWSAVIAAGLGTLLGALVITKARN